MTIRDWILAERRRVKTRAHQAMFRAVHLGEIAKQPCEVCGEPDTVAHHDDYRMPLEVRWLCRRHHSQWHVTHEAAGLPTAADFTFDQLAEVAS